MAVFKGDGIFSKNIFVVFRCSVLLLATNYQCSTEATAILMWTAPPPAWNQTNAGSDPADIQTAVYQVRNGSTNVLLRWNYTLLPGQALRQTLFYIDDGISQAEIGSVIGGPTEAPNLKYRDLFSIYSTSQFSNLTINKVTVQENATFQCRLRVKDDEGTSLWAYNIRVEVTDPAVITQISGNQTVNETDVVEPICSTKGMPRPFPGWTRVSDNSSVSFPLTITGKQDEGGYKCTADNGIGNPASQVVYIVVENYHPINTILRTSLSNKSVVVNISFNITCSSMANPPAKYQFYRNQDNFGNDTTGSDVSVITTSVSERIKQVNYSCTPFNDFGHGSTEELTLTVLYAPIVTSISGNTTVNESGTVNLTCTADGNPTPSTTWTKVSGETPVSFPLTNTGKQDAGGYRCTADNGVGNPESAVTFIDVQYAPNITFITSNKTVTESDLVTLICTADGNPTPTITWTRVPDSSPVSLPLTITGKRDEGGYRCTAENGVGNPDSDVTFINVHFAPRITFITGNTTVNESGTVNLTCSADSKPTANITWTRVSDNSTVSFPLIITGKQDEGGYRCTADNGIKTPDSNVTFITVQYFRPVNTVLYSTDYFVKLNKTFNITCSAKAKPRAKYSFYDGGRIISTRNMSGNTYIAVVRNRVKKVIYGCLPRNEIGNGCFKEVEVSVYFPPLVTVEPKRKKVEAGKNATFVCSASGNPPPDIVWTPGGNEVQEENVLHFEAASIDDEGYYTCSAENQEGTDVASVYLDVFDPENEALEVNGTMKLANETFKTELTNKSSKCYRTLTNRVNMAISGAFQRTDIFKEVYNDTKVNKYENGSVVVFFTIIFNDLVSIDDAILVLVNASENGTLGDLDVEPDSIKTFQPVVTTPATSSPTVTATTSTTSDDEDKEMLWIIIGASVGGTIVLAIVVAVVAWCVHHKRKCRRKGSKVRCSESEAFAPEEGNDHGHVNNGYAEAGPRAAAMKDMSQHQGASAVPTYAVVDKSAKKESKKDKKVEEGKPQAAPPQYAAVDKSKKKKKPEEPEATYAQVDKSKKSKKKPKPSEVLYADLGDFHQMQELPAVSTSPQALPPIKKPTPYGETQYADITQFLKGDATLPESNNSQGPGTGTQAAPAPENSNSQEPGTSTKEEIQAGNPGGNGGPGHETNF